MTSSKIFIDDILTKFFYNVNKPILKGLCKFQVDIHLNARVAAVHSLENLLQEISIHLYCGSHVGGQKDGHQPIFPRNMKNSPTFLAHNSLFVGPDNLDVIQRRIIWSYRPYQCLGQFDHNFA